jgi:hypothetical protein
MSFNVHQNAFEGLQKEWEPSFETFLKSEGIAKLQSRDISEKHYASFLRQFYYLYRENPRLLSLAHSKLKKQPRKFSETLFEEVAASVSADELLFQDLVCMNHDSSLLNSMQPCPSATAIISFAHYQMHYQSPLAHLGYILHFAYLGRRYGRNILNCWIGAGVPTEALGFLRQFASSKVPNFQKLEAYVNNLVTFQDDYQYVLYSLRVITHLHGYLINEAFLSADNPDLWGDPHHSLPEWLFESDPNLEKFSEP